MNSNTKEQMKKVRKWAIGNMECDLRSHTYPKIKKATHKNFRKALKQNFDGELEEFDTLKEDYEIFKIIEKW